MGDIGMGGGEKLVKGSTKTPDQYGRGVGGERPKVPFETKLPPTRRKKEMTSVRGFLCQ